MLQKSEYDFTGVRETEEWACVFYEYARESELYRKIAKDKPNLILSCDIRKPCPSISKLDIIFAGFCRPAIPLPLPTRLRCGIVTTCEGFPETAWLDLPEERRRWLCEGITQVDRRVSEWRRAAQPVAEVQLDKISRTAGARPSKNASIASTSIGELPDAFPSEELLTVAFRINLLHDAADIIKGFKTWLRTRKVPRPGRRSPLDKLHALAALRLRYSCRKHREAQALIKPLTDKDLGRRAYPSYLERGVYNTAVNNAVRYFRELLDLPADHLPISHTVGWGSERT